MCYNAADEMLRKAENDWRQEWMRVAGEGEEAAHEAQENWYWNHNKSYPESCCMDVLVALQDSVEILKCTPQVSSSS